MGWLRLVSSLKLQVVFAEYKSRLQGSSAKETCNFKEPSNRSHPIVSFWALLTCRLHAQVSFLGLEKLLFFYRSISQVYFMGLFYRSLSLIYFVGLFYGALLTCRLHAYVSLLGLERPQFIYRSISQRNRFSKRNVSFHIAHRALQIWIIGGVLVSFAEYSHFDRALLQKRPIILASLLVAATPQSRFGLF